MSTVPDSRSVRMLAAPVAVAVMAGTASAAELGLGSVDWTAPLDNYCERLGPGLWAEPLNAISNASFLIAAVVILIRQRLSGWADRSLAVLALLGGSVGIGSFLFHTLANRWTHIADVLPIAIFIFAYFFVAIRRFLQLGAITAGLATTALLLSTPWSQGLLQPLIGSSATYAPGLIATFGVAVAVPVFGRGSVPLLLVAAGLAFSAALGFRVLDDTLCATWSYGTHFFWHVFNGLAVGLALLAAERVGPATERLGWRRSRAGSRDAAIPLASFRGEQ